MWQEMTSEYKEESTPTLIPLENTPAPTMKEPTPTPTIEEPTHFVNITGLT
jgi:hypothetical protein